MNTQWKEFLQNQNARFADSGELLDFSSASVDPGQSDILADLSYLGVIRIQGEDAIGFLQGQTTNDIRKIDAAKGQLNGYCSPKGRLLASFMLLQRDSDLYMILDRALLEATLKRLRMYVLMSKVEMTDVSEEMAVCGLAGPKAEQIFTHAVTNIGDEDYASVQKDTLSAMRLPGQTPRFLLLSDAATMIEYWNTLSTQAQAVGHDNWKLTDIRAAIPSIHPETVEAFVPQMVNLQAIEGVSFKKGCYPGQEIVARMQYLGKLKRRMYRATVKADAAPRPGDEIFSAGSSSGQGAGKLVDAQRSPDGEDFEILAVIEIASAEQHDLHLGSLDGPKLQLIDLPYPLEQAS